MWFAVQLQRGDVPDPAAGPLDVQRPRTTGDDGGGAAAEVATRLVGGASALWVSTDCGAAALGRLRVGWRHVQRLRRQGGTARSADEAEGKPEGPVEGFIQAARLLLLRRRKRCQPSLRLFGV